MNKRICEIRKEAGLTQEKFAQKMGISQNYVNLIENNKKKPGERLISDICQQFNINEKWLRTGKGDMHTPQTQNQEIIDFANQIMSDEDESFRKRFVSALAKAKPEFWDDLERIVDETLNKD